MVKFETFKKTINSFNKNNIRFWVFGGFALDGMRGKISREHDDIDIYVLSEDLAKLENLYRPKKYSFYKRESMYFMDSKELKLGVVVLTEEKNTIIANGNKTLAKYPKQLFSEDKIVSIDNFCFRIVPPEILFLESKFSRHEQDRVYSGTLKIDKKLFSKIKTVKIRD